MNEEIILWRYRLAGFLEHLGKSTVERLLTSVILIGTLLAFVALFYTIGQYAGQYETSFRWVSLGLALVFMAGFLGHIRPNSIQNSLAFLPISQKTITWHNISAGLRFPLLVGALLLIPFFIGKNANWFYSTADVVMLTVATLGLLIAGYLAAVATALGIRTVTRHAFIRLLAIIAIFVLVFEFLVGQNVLTDTIELTLQEVNRSAIFLLLTGSVGASGVAVALLELCDPLPSEYQPHRYWTIIQRTRNLRATFSQYESSFFRTLLQAVRSPQLHLRLVLMLLVLVAFRAILVGTVPQYPSLQIALHALGMGVVAYLICFANGQETVKFEQRFFHLPIQGKQCLVGTYLATILIYTIVTSLFLGPNPVHWVLGYTIALTVGTVAFMFGRREASSSSIVPLTWLALLLALPTILAVVLGTIVEQATTSETIVVTTVWIVAYLTLPLLFGSSPRLPERSAVQ